MYIYEYIYIYICRERERAREREREILETKLKSEKGHGATVRKPFL